MGGETTDLNRKVSRLMTGIESVVSLSQVQTNMVQNVQVDEGNSSILNLTSANEYTFTGVGKSTLGVVGLQFNLKTDQNATIYVEQSDANDENWDISDSFDYIYSKGGMGGTVQAVTAYWRLRVVLVGTTDTTYFRLAAVLCPIASPLPRSLSDDFRLKTETTISGKQNDNRHAWVHPLNGLISTPRYRLVGTNFDGDNKDPNFWVESLSSTGGLATQSGGILLETKTTPNGAIKYVSKRKARFVVGSPMIFTGFASMESIAQVDNLRRFGAYNDSDGYFFEIDGIAFSLGTRKGGASDVLIANGSFNGKYGSTWNPEVDIHYRMEIEYTLFGVDFYIDGVTLHSISDGHLTDSLTLPITIENINSNDNDTNNIIHLLGANISREGELLTNPISKYNSGTIVDVLKYGAGTVKGMILSAIVHGADINLYDGLTTAGAAIWKSGNLTAKTEPFNVDFYGLPFSDGLTSEIVDASADVLVIYE